MQRLRSLIARYKLATSAVLLGVVLLALAGILIATSPKTTSKAGPAATPRPEAVIQITKDGFVPASLQVAAGTRVVWVNKDVMPHQIAANPYPSHAELPALFSQRVLAQNETYGFVFTKARTVDYHDELNPSTNGVITVK